MAFFWEFRSPRLLSPEERRAFYAIPLQRKNNVSKTVEPRSVSPQSRVYCDDDWTLSSSPTSFFSSQASMASSATSISDITTSATSAISTAHKVTTSQLTFHALYPHGTPGVRGKISRTALVSGEACLDLESQFRDPKCKGVGQLGDWTEVNFCP